MPTQKHGLDRVWPGCDFSCCLTVLAGSAATPTSLIIVPGLAAAGAGSPDPFLQGQQVNTAFLSSAPAPTDTRLTAVLSKPSVQS